MMYRKPVACVPGSKMVLVVEGTDVVADEDIINFFEA